MAKKEVIEGTDIGVGSMPYDADGIVWAEEAFYGWEGFFVSIFIEC